MSQKKLFPAFSKFFQRWPFLLLEYIKHVNGHGICKVRKKQSIHEEFLWNEIKCEEGYAQP